MAEPAVNPGWRKSSYSDNGGTGCVEVSAIPWRKSSYSDNGGGSCVEVGAIPEPSILALVAVALFGLILTNWQPPSYTRS